MQSQHAVMIGTDYLQFVVNGNSIHVLNPSLDIYLAI